MEDEEAIEEDVPLNWDDEFEQVNPPENAVLMEAIKTGNKRTKKQTLNSSLDSTSSIENSLEHAQLKKLRTDYAANNVSLGFNLTKTMMSNNKKVIVIKPEGTNSKTFTSDPAGLAIAIKNSLFGNVKREEIRVNTRRNLIAIERNAWNEAEIENLLVNKKIGKWDVTWYRPGIHSNSWGVIKGIDLAVDVTSLTELAESDDGRKILKFERLPMFVNGKKEDSRALKVIIEGPKLSDYIYLYWFHSIQSLQI